MHRRQRWFAVALVWTVGVAGVLAGCGGSKPEAAQPQNTSAATRKVVDLRIAGRADGASIDDAVTLIGDRLKRLGVNSAAVSKQGKAIRIETPAGIDPFALEAAARADPVVVRPLTKTEPPPCEDPAANADGEQPPAGTDAVRLAAPALGGFCLSAGPGVSLGTAVNHAEAVAEPEVGWTVKIALVAPISAHLPAELAKFSARDVALVAGTEVISWFAWAAGAPSLESRIEGTFSEWEARRVAAALVVSDALPVRLVVPRPAAPDGPIADVDVWSAALAVNVCGRWLGNAPSFAGGASASAGLHSHGDGLLSIHPSRSDEAGVGATLGHFFGEGGWTLDAERIKAWDGQEHRNGDTCPDGRTATLRYTVDGVERDGDPADLRLANRMVITIAFVPAGTRVGPPPQARLLDPPRWVPAPTP